MIDGYKLFLYFCILVQTAHHTGKVYGLAYLNATFDEYCSARYTRTLGKRPKLGLPTVPCTVDGRESLGQRRLTVRPKTAV